jgi:UDP:flavonoid glycosyltransferase YjiC (YdhE family)
VPEGDPGLPTQAPASRRKVLFFAEAVTLAHLARPVALASRLDPLRYDVRLAAADRYPSLRCGLPFPVRPIQSIPGEEFLDNLARGRPVYPESTLRAYIEEDLAVIREFGPDVVVGDFRLSLSVGARLAGVPYLAIANAYWSPFARQRYTVPSLPMVRWLGVPAAQAVFRAARPLAFALHTRPLNRVRRGHGLRSLGLDLRRVYTDADQVLYADVPDLVPAPVLPPNHHYLGPVLWSAPADPPPWWDRLDTDRPVVYVTLGSSGSESLLPAVLEAIAGLPVVVIVATLGRALPRSLPANVLTADFLPGEAAAARSRLVVCNGGSPTAHQALAAGTPVLGLAGNLDQFLNMSAVERAGAGLLLRADTADVGAVRAAAGRILSDSSFSESAASLAKAFAAYDAPARFRAVLDASCPKRCGAGVADG